VAWQFPAARRRAAGRERVLADAGSALLAAPDAAAVHRVAAAATAELLGLEAPAGGPKLPVAAELVPDEVRDALASLRVQVTLALERADLAAEVARRAITPPARPRPCSCWTWTTSRRSTTASGTPRATRCCGWWRSGCGAACGRGT
jgi:hypothetical protein